MSRPSSKLTAVIAVGLLVLVGCTSSPSDGGSSSSSQTSPGSGGTSAATASASEAAASGSSTPSITSGSGASSPADPPTPTGPEQLSPVGAELSTTPQPVTGTNGTTYLAYELYLTNIMDKPATIGSVQVVTDDGTVLQEVSGADLLDHIRILGVDQSAPRPPDVVLQGGQQAILWLDPSVKAGAPIPTAIEHQVKVSYPEAPDALVPADVTETVAATAVSQIPAPVLVPPLSGSNWVDANGCCDEVTAHRGASNPIGGHFNFPERFAIDWIQLTSDGHVVTGDPSQVSSYPYYGTPITAAVDGTIVTVFDGLSDQTPGAFPAPGVLTLEQIGGNHVVERFTQNGQTYYAFYAHMKPGTASATVKVGQTVRAGDKLGELGNTGNTAAPHLHFHVMDGPDPIASNGVPYVFDQVDLVGQVQEASIDTALTGGTMTMAPNGAAGERQDEMPLYLDVVDFPPAAPATSGSPTSGSPSAGSPSSSAGR